MKRIYLPQIDGNAGIKPPPVKPPGPYPVPVVEATPPPPGKEFPPNLVPGALAFASAWFKLLGTRSKLMIPDARLIQAAQLHAEYLANRTPEQKVGKILHDGRNGSQPNERVRATGYELPGWWSVKGNGCECCSVQISPQKATEKLQASPAHRPALMGERVNDFFWHRHIVWGVGEARDFYVLCVAPIEGEFP